MDLEKPVVTKLALRGADLVLIGELEQKVNKVTRKFLFTDITPDNLNFIAWEINQIAKQLLGEHKFFNCEDNSFYSFSHMKMVIHKFTQSIEIKPCFTKEVDIIDTIKK